MQKGQDLRYFKMNISRRKDLIGMRKVGRCIRSFYCMSDDCPFKENQTLQTFKMWMDTRFASGVEI